MNRKAFWLIGFLLLFLVASYRYVSITRFDNGQFRGYYVGAPDLGWTGNVGLMRLRSRFWAIQFDPVERNIGSAQWALALDWMYGPPEIQVQAFGRVAWQELGGGWHCNSIALPKD